MRIKLILYILALFTIHTSYGQKTNAYQFIEPNISVEYDSSFLKVSNIYGDNNAFDFKGRFKNIDYKNVIIHIQPYSVYGEAVKEYVNNIVMDALNEYINGHYLKGDRIPSLRQNLYVDHGDSLPRQIKNFLCRGFVMYDTIKAIYRSIIKCYRKTDEELIKIELNSEDKNLDKNYRILTHFIDGIKSYSKEKIEEEDSILKHKYNITIMPRKALPEEFKFCHSCEPSFLGLLKIEPNITNKIKGYIIRYPSLQYWNPQPHAPLRFTCFDKQKGLIKKEGELIIYNSFGKTVTIPFTFSYINK